jgi:hypothetical protein
MAPGDDLMAKHSFHILELARRGAEHKYMELKAELAQLVRAFPDLASRTTGAARRSPAPSTRRRAADPSASGEDQPRRRRRKLSAKARKAISDAQKKRWAAQKAAATADATPAIRKGGKKRA